jgi:hypothetical protein
MNSLMTVEALTIPVALDRLSTPPGGRFLSAYLDASPRRQAGRASRLAYLDGCKALRAALDPAERARFDAAAAAVDRYLAEAFAPHRPRLALFVGADGGHGYAVALPRPPAEGVAWDERPRLEPLEAAVDDAARVAVVLFDQERTRLFTVWLGEVEERLAFADAVPGKQATGGWSGLAQARYARHREEHVLRHAKRTTRALMALLRRHPFDRLLLAGPDEALATLRHHVPRPLQARLAGTLELELSAGDVEVLAAARGRRGDRAPG